MYKTHPAVNPPSEDAILWRYMDFTKFVSLLDKNSLFLASVDKLGDPFECTLTYSNVQSLRLHDEGFSSMNMDALLKSVRTSTVVSSWHESGHESAAMWRLYSSENDGVAIKTDFSSFKKSLQDEKDLYIGRVDYIDYQTDFILIDNLLTPLFYKRISFSHEHEVRAVHVCFPEGTYDSNLSDFPTVFDPGIYYQVDLSLLIQEVVVAPYADNWYIELVESISDRYGLRAPIKKSNLAALPAQYNGNDPRQVIESNI